MIVQDLLKIFNEKIPTKSIDRDVTTMMEEYDENHSKQMDLIGNDNSFVSNRMRSMEFGTVYLSIRWDDDSIFQDGI